MNNIFFNFIETEIGSMDKYPTLINDIFERRVDGVVVRDFFGKEELERINKNINSKQAQVVTPQTFGHVIGTTLTQSKPDLSDYLEKSEIFKSELQEILEFDFEERFSKFLESISKNIKAHVPEHNGKKYTPATLRIMNTGHPMTVHVGLEFLDKFEETQHIAAMIDSTFQFSFFVVINQPEDGGELVLYNVRWPNSPEKMFNNGNYLTVEQRLPLVNTLDQMIIKPKLGSLILFNGGNIWHRVSEIKGPKQRITLGGFMGISREGGDKIYYWS